MTSSPACNTRACSSRVSPLVTWPDAPSVRCAHIPFGPVKRLRHNGIEATHVNRILNGSESSGCEIAAFVDGNDMLLISKDGDFRDSHFLTCTPARSLRITLGNRSYTELTTLVEAHWPLIAEFAEQDQCLRYPL